LKTPMNKKTKILFVTPILGHPPKGGPELRIENSIKALSRISTVTLYCRTFHAQMGGDDAIEYLHNFVDKIYFSPFYRQSREKLSFSTRLLNLIFRKFLGRNAFPVATAEGEADFLDVVSTAEALHADVIWLGYGNVSYPLLKYIKEHSRIPVVVDTDSVWSRFVLRGCPFAKDELERKRVEAEGKAKEQEERWGTRLADVTTAVSEVDAEYYRGLTGNPDRVHIFSNVIDLKTYKSTSPPSGFIKPCIYLAGSFWPNSPMEDSARWMLECVLPILKQEVPDIHFYIAGRGSDQILSDVNDENVTVAGELSSVLPYLTNATIAIVPLRFESGTRFKILEAGACGIAVVSTTLGAEGIPTTNGKDILIADTPEEFAQAIIKIVCDRQLAENLGLNLKELVSQGYSIDALAAEGQAILHYLLEDPGINSAVN
jgi:glycosyltransferase involved in cell wall biosynthesis